MDKNIVYSGQSFLNKVVECTGDVANAFEMAVLNGINIHDDVSVGTELVQATITKKGVVDYFNETNRPATALIEENYGFPEGEFPIGL